MYICFSTGSHINCFSSLETTTVLTLCLVSLKVADSSLHYAPCACKTLVLTSEVKDLT